MAIVNRIAPTTAGLGPMSELGMIVRTVKNNRNGSRRPPRSDSAPRNGETRALRPTLIAMATPWMSWPGPAPNRASEVSHRPIAVDTTA